MRARHAEQVQPEGIQAPFSAVLEPGLEMDSGDVEPAVSDGVHDQAVEGQRGVLFVAVALRELKRGLKLEPTSIWIGAELGRGDVAEGVCLRLGISERSRKLERAITPCHRFGRVLDDHSALRDVGVGHRELVAGGQPFEQFNRLEHEWLCLGSSAREEQQTRQSPERISLA